MGPNSSLQLFEGQIEMMDDRAKFFLVLADGKTRRSGHSCDLGGTRGPSLGGCCSPGVDWWGHLHPWRFSWLARQSHGQPAVRMVIVLLQGRGETGDLQRPSQPSPLQFYQEETQGPEPHPVAMLKGQQPGVSCCEVRTETMAEVA